MNITWTVIVCTHNRAFDLRKNLPRLRRLDYPSERYEILLVDNASTDDTAAAAAAEGITYLREDRLGLSHARNRGIEAAQGELIAFIDDDAWPEENWLTELEKAFEDPQVACAGGRVVPAFATQSGWPEWLPDRLREFFTVVDYPTRRDLHYPGYPAGTNIAFRKSALTRTGSFSASLGRSGQSLLSMEEIELCLKIERASYRIQYLPEAVVHHSVNEQRLSPEWVRERCYWQGISAATLETEQFPRSKVILRSSLYLLFILVGALAQMLYLSIGDQRGAFFCRCQAILCKAYLKKAWT